jgi:hypothetical protein
MDLLAELLKANEERTDRELRDRIVRLETDQAHLPSKSDFLSLEGRMSQKILESDRRTADGLGHLENRIDSRLKELAVSMAKEREVIEEMHEEAQKNQKRLLTMAAVAVLILAVLSGSELATLISKVLLTGVP